MDDHSVFVNCPFDREFRELLQPLLFTIVWLGFEPKLASLEIDSGRSRIEKIGEHIRSCRYSIHDLSRLRAGRTGEVHRMNMPFELGMDYGVRHLAETPRFRAKRFLVTAEKPYEYMQALSDLNGIDIEAHGSDPRQLVRKVRDWLYGIFAEEGRPSRPEPSGVIWKRFSDFMGDFYERRKKQGFTPTDLDEMRDLEFVEAIVNYVESVN